MVPPLLFYMYISWLSLLKKYLNETALHLRHVTLLFELFIHSRNHWLELGNSNFKKSLLQKYLKYSIICSCTWKEINQWSFLVFKRLASLNFTKIFHTISLVPENRSNCHIPWARATYATTLSENTAIWFLF